MIKNIIEETNKNIVQVKQQIENISATESNLDAKISKKENDLERIRKRLETLKGVRLVEFYSTISFMVSISTAN